MTTCAHQTLCEELSGCQLCNNQFEHDCRPIFQIHSSARILIAGQAPGRLAHESGIPFNDPSGKRLREWMGIDKATFYDSQKVAIVPMAFCYPGSGQGGDLPPPSICASTWRSRILSSLPNVRLSLLIGQHAQAWHLPEESRTLTDRVRNADQYPDSMMPLPHPSPRNNIWLKRNPWFEAQTLPKLKTRIEEILELK